MVKIISDDGRDKIEVEGCVCVRLWIKCQSKSMLFTSGSLETRMERYAIIKETTVIAFCFVAVFVKQ